MAEAAFPLSIGQNFDLLEANLVNASSLSAAAFMCRAERLLLQSTGATCVHAFLVNHRFNKLLRFSSTRGTVGDVAVGPQYTQHVDRTLQHQQESTFHLDTVCDIGEGIAGIAAKTGRKLRVRDCSGQQSRALCPNHTRGSLVCWPVREQLLLPPAAVEGTGDGCDSDSSGMLTPESTEELRAFEQLEDVDGEVNALKDGGDALARSSRAVLAVLQIYSVEGELPAEAIDVVQTTGRLLAPLLTDAVIVSKENVRRRSAEALSSLGKIVPSKMKLATMVEKVVSVAERLANAERVCLFFVDVDADELRVARKMDFDGAKKKNGCGLCEVAVATGLTVNVIDSCEDSRFDARLDRQMGFVTKSVLSVPIPPHDQESSIALTRTAEGRYSCFWDRQSGSGDGGGNNSRRRRGASLGRGAWMPTTGSRSQDQGKRGKALFSLKKGMRRHPRSIPIAVLEVMNKRGGGVFEEHEEIALVQMCASVGSLLRRKAAEVALLHRRHDRGGTGGTASSYARIERTLLRLHSEDQVKSVVSERNHPPMTRKEYQQVRGGRLTNKELEANASFLVKDNSMTDCIGSTSPNKTTPGFRSCGIDGDSTDPDKDMGTALEREESVSSSDGSDSDWKKQEGETDRTSVSEGIEIDSDLLDLSINMFDLSAEQQLSLVKRFYRSMGLMETFNISEQKLSNFVSAVGERYNANPFHNLAHATSVTQVVFKIINTTQVNSLLRPLDKLGLLTAAFCHDIDHPGNNNAYEVNSASPLAVLHGESSVLERHHISVAYQVLLEDDGANNIMSELTPSLFQEVRQVMTDVILATDMSRHMQYCAEVADFAQRAKTLREGEGTVTSERSAGRRATSLLSPGLKASWQAEASQAVATSKELPAGTKFPRLDTASTEDTPRSTPRSALGTQGAGRRRSLQEHEISRSYSDSKSSREGRGRRTDKDEEPIQLFSVHSAVERSSLSNIIMHCADLSGQVLDGPLAQEWGGRILEEFRLQAKREAQAGLPSTTVASSDPWTTLKDQHFFVTKLVKPLWKSFVSIFPELEPLLVNLNRNCDFYQREAARLEKERLSTASSSKPEKGQEETSPGAN